MDDVKKGAVDSPDLPEALPLPQASFTVTISKPLKPLQQLLELRAESPSYYFELSREEIKSLYSQLLCAPVKYLDKVQTGLKVQSIDIKEDGTTTAVIEINEHTVVVRRFYENIFKTFKGAGIDYKIQDGYIFVTAISIW
jgi:hypothetical protein